MKFKTVILAAVIACAGIFGVGCSHYVALQTEKQMYKLTKISSIDLSKVQDGTYVGSYEMILTTAMARVTVAGGKIVTIDLLEHQFNRNHSGEPVIKQVLDKQSLVVDGVTGATYSTKSVLKAIERALLAGLQK